MIYLTEYNIQIECTLSNNGSNIIGIEYYSDSILGEIDMEQ